MTRERPDPAGKFKSFKDLRRSRGGADLPTPPSEGRPEELVEQYGDSALAETSRERIAQRPRAFGPMEHGPAIYRDEDSEEMQLLASFRVRTVFPKDVLDELRSLPRDPAPGDFVGRQDLRQELIYTIDGEDAQDFDDAISIQELGGGKVEIGVHIADVAHYVVPGTALDAEALARGTSVYVADQVVPMLPEALSNNLCSLVGGTTAPGVLGAHGLRRAGRAALGARGQERDPERAAQHLQGGAGAARRRRTRPARAR